MTILSDNRFSPPIDPALLDRVAVLGNEISDLEKLIRADWRTRSDAVKAAEQDRRTIAENDRVRDRILDLENRVRELTAEVARL